MAEKTRSTDSRRASWTKTIWNIVETPITDLVQGRINPRSSIERRIDAQGFPEPLARALRLRLAVGWRRLFTSHRRRAALVDTLAETLRALAADDAIATTVAARIPTLLKRPWLTSSIVLPSPLDRLVEQVVRRTRLWKSESQDVAAELASHFSEGLAAGESPASLAEAFGDPQQAARLIRRAKLRNRPLRHRMLRRAMQALCLLALAVALFECLLIARFVLARPTITHNYLEDVNAVALRVPKSERAWPLYRSALVKLERPLPNWDPFADHSEDRERNDRKKATAYLVRNEPLLELVRQAAHKPHLGVVYGDPEDAAWRKVFRLKTADPFLGSPPLLINLGLAQVSDLRALALLLAADAIMAREAQDARRLRADVVALIEMAEQLSDHYPFSITDNISFSVFNMALKTTAETLATAPELFARDDLVELAHRVSAYRGGGRLRLRMDGEFAFVHDTFQHAFTDDGDGDGRLTPEGVKVLMDFPFGLLVPFEDLNRPQSDLSVPLAANVAAIVARRKELTDLAEHYFAEIERGRRGPMWEWAPIAVEEELIALTDDPLRRVRYAPLVQLLPAIESLPRIGEFYTQTRDALLTAIALELFHRRSGHWPKNLAELAPDLLPEVPPDRFTGRPLNYRVVNDKPLLYSAGADRDDDGGRPTEDNLSRFGRATMWHIRQLKPQKPLPVDGDWVLYPPVKRD